MKKLFTLILVSSALITLHNTALSMNPTPDAQPAQGQPLINVQGHLIPDAFILSIAPSTLFSSVGAF
ncbi:hypothetical protein ACI3PL_31235, partial [Lacticaseibacillus paracasei]